MPSSPDMLQKLRRIVLIHAIDGAPELNLLAADLRTEISRCRGHHDAGLAALIARSHGHEQWLLGEHRHPRVSMMLMTWPANFCGPLYQEGEFWSLQLVLQGALKIETIAGASRSASSCEWLGAGDTRIIQSSPRQISAGYTRNLSKSEAAVSLHIYGASPASLAAQSKRSASRSGLNPSRLLPTRGVKTHSPNHLALSLD